MDKLRKFWRLPWSDQKLLSLAVLRLTAVSFAVRLVPFAVWRGRLENRATPPPSTRGGASLDQIIWAVTVAGRYVPGANCLVRALVARSMLWQAGHAAHLRLGVSVQPQRPFQAHAWLENQGGVVLGGAETVPHYTPLTTDSPRRSPLAH
jgi:hypothetical protein